MMGDVVIWAGVVPAVVAGVAALAATRLSRWPRLQGVLAATAVGLAYVLASWGTTGLQGGPEARLVMVAGVGALMGALESVWSKSAARWTARLVASALASWLLVGPLVAPSGWSAVQTAGLVALLAAATLLVWATLCRLAEADHGPLLYGLLAALVGAGSAAVLLSGLASLGQLSGTLAVPLVAFGLASWLRPGGAALRGAAPALALLLVAHWTTALLYGEMKPVTFGLLTAAPLVLLVPRLSRHELLVAAVRLLLMMVPLGGALATSATQYFGDASAPAASSSPSASGEDEDDDDYGYDP